MIELQRLLNRALAAAFNQAELEQLLSDTFGVSLAAIAPAGTMPEMALEVVRWAVRTNNLQRMVQAIVQARPNNPEVSEIFGKYVRLALPSQASLGGQSDPDMDLRKIVDDLARVIDGDKRTPGLFERIDKYIEDNESWKRDTERRMRVLESRWWFPWGVAAVGWIATIVSLWMK